jgi:glycine amidinotransferase/scyllo-inosamine-4-phosphate amidinotransferase 1
VRNAYCYAHIDSTITALRPGLVLLNPERINEDNIPEPLRKWDKIWTPPPVDIGFAAPYELCSAWISMNMLSVDPETVIVESRQTDLIRMLESARFTVIPVRMRHARTLGGGPHCCTLDVRRRGRLESYF